MVMGTLRGDESNEPAATSRTGRVARSLPDGKLCHYVIFDNKTANAIEDRIGRATKASPSQKKKDRQRLAGANRLFGVHLQIELIAVWDPAIAALPLIDIANSGKGHMEARHKNLVRG